MSAVTSRPIVPSARSSGPHAATSWPIVKPGFLHRGCARGPAAEPLAAGFRYHDLRHYLASLLIADGADVKTVQTRLRHASAKTSLDTYGHMWPDRDESTRATIEAVFTARAELGRNAGDVL